MEPAVVVGALTVVLGVLEIVFGAIRVPSDQLTGFIFLGSGVFWILLGVRQIVIRRRAPGSDGGTADRP